MPEKKTLRTHLTLTDAMRFAAAKFSKGAACPRCDNIHWEYVDESLTNEILGFGIINDQGSSSGIYATVVFKCKNCGFIAPHAKDIVVQWLNDNEQ